MLYSHSAVLESYRVLQNALYGYLSVGRQVRGLERICIREVSHRVSAAAFVVFVVSTLAPTPEKKKKSWIV